MNSFVLAASLCPLAALVAQVPESMDLDREPHPMGAYSPAGCDTELVLEARDYIQKHLPELTLAEITEAYTQVVAGLNVKLVCKVLDADGQATWQFVAFRSLDKHWHLTSAKRMG